MKYEYVLFDADETLFSFNVISGLRVVFSAYGIDFTQGDLETYQSTNKPLWLEYQDGIITADYLQVTRFNMWAERVGVSAKQLNDEFLDAMATICEPLPGAVQLLGKLKNKVKLGIVTNGFQRMQSRRIKHTGLDGMFDWLVISELVGLAKPNKAIFEHTFELMGNPNKDKILMVGDTLNSDILGGYNADIDTCWLQHPNAHESDDIKPTYKINRLHELEGILGV
jgi:putative hydrolase of the HAD superfamily/5'-nucleotidase